MCAVPQSVSDDESLGRVLKLGGIDGDGVREGGTVGRVGVEV